jgi:hypothetical protein
VLKTFADEQQQVTMSYRALARYSGKTSDATIARVLRRLEHMCILKVQRGGRSNFRDVGSYTLTPDSPHLQKLIREGTERLRRDSSQEKEARALLRKSRVYTSTKSLFTTVKYEGNAHFTGVKCAVIQRRDGRAAARNPWNVVEDQNDAATRYKSTERRQ